MPPSRSSRGRRTGRCSSAPATAARPGTPQGVYACAGRRAVGGAVDHRRRRVARARAASWASPEWATDDALATGAGRRAAHDRHRRRAGCVVRRARPRRHRGRVARRRGAGGAGVGPDDPGRAARNWPSAASPSGSSTRSRGSSATRAPASAPTGSTTRTARRRRPSASTRPRCCATKLGLTDEELADALPKRRHLTRHRTWRRRVGVEVRRGATPCGGGGGRRGGGRRRR